MATHHMIIQCRPEPLIGKVIDRARENPKFGEKLLALAEKDGLFTGGMVKGEMVLHFTNEALELFYKEMGV